jgi:hypothetical protein
MESAVKTAECLEMAGVMAGNRTHVADDIDWCVSQIESRYGWNVMTYHPVILHCRNRIVASRIAHQVEPSVHSTIEIPLWTCSVQQRQW